MTEGETYTIRKFAKNCGATITLVYTTYGATMPPNSDMKCEKIGEYVQTKNTHESNVQICANSGCQFFKKY